MATARVTPPPVERARDQFNRALIWGCTVVLPLALLIAGLFLLPAAIALLAAGDLFFGLAALFAYFYASAWKEDLRASKQREAAMASQLADKSVELGKSREECSKLATDSESERTARAKAESDLKLANAQLEAERQARMQAEASLQTALGRIDAANAESDRERARADTAEGATRALSGELAATQAALKDERDTTQRAGYIPSISIQFSVGGFGILHDRTVVAHVVNNGPGVAHRVQVYAGQGGPLVPVGFSASLDVRKSINVQVGKIPRGSPAARIQVRVEYGSQFGQLPAVDLFYQP